MPEPVQTLTAAVAEAQTALAAYLEPGGPDAAETISRLLAILDHENIVRAMEALRSEAAGQ